jgi:hypothetical protein
MEIVVLKVLNATNQDPLVLAVLKVLLVFKVLTVTEEKKVLVVLKVQPVTLVMKVLKEKEVQLVQSALTVLKVKKVPPVVLVL